MPRNPAHASFESAEVCDVSAADYTITINNGIAFGLFLGTTGDVKVDTPEGETITYSNVPAGFNPISCTKIYTAGTTVTNKSTDIIAGAW